jgi:hypothetical protein
LYIYDEKLHLLDKWCAQVKCGTSQTRYKIQDWRFTVRSPFAFLWRWIRVAFGTPFGSVRRYRTTHIVQVSLPYSLLVYRNVHVHRYRLYTLYSFGYQVHTNRRMLHLRSVEIVVGTASQHSSSAPLVVTVINGAFHSRGGNSITPVCGLNGDEPCMRMLCCCRAITVPGVFENWDDIPMYHIS